MTPDPFLWNAPEEVQSCRSSRAAGRSAPFPDQSLHGPTLGRQAHTIPDAPMNTRSMRNEVLYRTLIFVLGRTPTPTPPVNKSELNCATPKQPARLSVNLDMFKPTLVLLLVDQERASRYIEGIFRYVDR